MSEFEMEKNLGNRETAVSFRWYVTLPTSATHVLFNCPFSQVPLAMSPKKHNGSDIYESSEVTVPCGLYTKCTLKIDSKDHILEAVEIRHYSFEVDLYIDENIGEEETGNVNANCFIVGSTSSQYAVVSEPNDMVRISSRKIAEETRMDDVIDDESCSVQTSPRNLGQQNAFDSVLLQQTDDRESVADAVVWKEAVIGPESSRIFYDKKNISSAEDRDRVHLFSSDSLGLSMDTSKAMKNEVSAENGFEPIRTPSSVTTSSRPDLDWLNAGDRNRGTPDNSLSSSFVSEPELKKFAAAIRRNEPGTGGYGVPIISRQNADSGKESSVSLRSRSVETVLGRRSLNSCDIGTHSHHQELDLAGLPKSNLHSISQISSQDIQDSQNHESRGRLPTDINFERSSNNMTSLVMVDSDAFGLSFPRASSAVPILRSPLVTSRTTPIGSGPLRVMTSYHNSPLVAAPHETINHRDVIKQDSNSDGRIESLKLLVTERDAKIKDLLQEKNYLQSFLSEAQQPSSPDQVRRVKELTQEKENLATQLWKVKQDLDKFTSVVKKTESYCINNRENGNSSNPPAVQKQLDDLNSHIQDLQEANEAAAARLEQADKIIATLRNENNALRSQSETSLEELHKQDFILKEQLHHLQIGRRSDDTGLLREEIQVLREELRILRDKNHHLVQENIKLTECIKDLQQFSSHPLLAKTEASYEDHTQDEDVYSVSWMSKIKDERENYSVGHRMRSEAHSSSPIRTTHSTSDASLQAPGLHYSSDSKTQWSDSESVDTNQLITGSSLFTRNFAGVRRDSIKSDATLTSSFLMEIPSGYSHKNNFVKGDLVQSPLTSENFIRTRRWSVPKQTGNASHSEIEEITPLKRTSGLNSSSCALNHPSAALSPATDYVHGHMDLRSLSDTFSTNEMKVNLNSKNKNLTPTPPQKPNSKRLSVCSNSTELILLEADRMISATKGMSKQNLTLPPTFKTVPQLSEPLKISENSNILRKSPKEPLLQACSKRPFAPRSPSDISIEDIVKFSRNGGHISKGQVKFIGHLPGKSDTYLGVELDSEMGKHDGVFEGTRYFQCKPNKGVFVAFGKVVMAWHD